ncbi:hypothetical protein Tco_0507988 [Tanacetum coccineum]
MNVLACAQLKFGFPFQALVASLNLLGLWFIVNCLPFALLIREDAYSTKFAWDFPCSTECRGDHYRSHMKKINMVIKDLDLEPKIDAMMMEFLDPSRWKELSKETSSSLEDIPRSNTTKIEYLYTEESNIQEKIKFKLKSANVRRTYQLCAALLLKSMELKT